jgi:hypothetical protein
MLLLLLRRRRGLLLVLLGRNPQSGAASVDVTTDTPRRKQTV